MNAIPIESKNEYSGMKNSSATNVLAFAGADRDQGVPAPSNAPGLTCQQNQASGGNRGHASKDAPFTVVTRSKRGRLPEKDDGALASASPSPPHSKTERLSAPKGGQSGLEHGCKGGDSGVQGPFRCGMSP